MTFGVPCATATSEATDSTGARSVDVSYTSGRVTAMAESLASGATGARSWGYGYDGAGHLTGYTDAAGKTTSYCYTGNLLTKIITPVGVAAGGTCSTSSGGTDVTDIAYDAAGRVNSITYENGAAPFTVTFSTLTPLTATNPGTTRLVDPYSQHTDYTYDAGDKITKTINPLGNTATATFNTNNDVTASVSANNYTGGGSDPATTATYDANNNPTKVQIPTGASASATYNGAQTYQPDTAKDDLGNSTTPLYGVIGSGNGDTQSVSKGTATVLIRHQGDSGVANCGPSGTAAYAGAVCETRDADYSPSTASSHRTLYAYDTLGRLVTVTPAAPGGSRAAPPSQTIGYDGQSRVTSQTSSRGKTTTFGYDKLDRLIKASYDDGHYTAYTYDFDGDELTVADTTSGGTVTQSDTLTYDKVNRTASETALGRQPANLVWDANSRLKSFDDGAGTMSYGYDSDGALTSIAEPGGTCAGFNPTTNPPTTASLCTVMLVDRNGNRLVTVYPGNLARQTTSYDTSGRVSEIKATGQSGGAAATLYDYVYGYTGTTDSGHIVTRTDGITGAYLTYTYTGEGRLKSSVSRTSSGTVTSSRTWCYDANGNRTTFSATIGATCPGTATSSWDGANQQLTGPDGAASLFVFDLDGQETSTATAATTRTSTYSVSDQTATTNVAGTNLTTTYLGGGNNDIITSDVNTTDQDELRNTPLGVSRVSRTSNGTETSRLYAERDPSGAIFAYRTTTNAHYYPLTDIQGSVMRVVDATGTVADSYNYSEWGVQTVTTNTFPQPFGYLGAYTNSATGLIHLGARYYDPTLGRFTQPDPSTHPGDVNQSSPYTYAGDDPINHTDRSGLDSNTQEIGGCVFHLCAHIGETTDSNGDEHFDAGAG